MSFPRIGLTHAPIFTKTEYVGFANRDWYTIYFTSVVLKIYQKLNKWTQDENSAWRDMVFHAKNFKMEKIVEREFSKNAFGILITNLENILKLDEHNLFQKADSPLVTVQMNLNRVNKINELLLI